MEKFTEDEKIIAKHIYKKYKWMARDKSGNLYIYYKKPSKGTNSIEWIIYGGWARLFGFEDLFKSVTWEDAEPTLIKDIYDPRILDDAERRYLEGVIRPWKTQVKTIRKSQFTHVITKERVECINITTRQGDLQYMFRLPNFKAGTMYEGMEPGREYTLKELGLFKGV